MNEQTMFKDIKQSKGFSEAIYIKEDLKLINDHLFSEFINDQEIFIVNRLYDKINNIE